ncbi:MAG: AraC family transcriptional regulator ligand-binding domain-containing protein [Comamonas sp.]|jgi:AraC-like DNA-binding protein|uniref:AraC family transcriptional regulator n=1 Tax=Comamonas sp. TaxID=34028 RepID=UPI00281F1F78|nr:AraC family transcriptional regulator ligand-binding domain-containing protein [Comamonas sp.]MDR0212466.1 AraC family transcriptional regulator ligand-binding domain-containing protein [Comamonas sp.]
MTALMRSASLAHYADLAISVGLQPLEMLAAVGLPRSCFENTELRIPAASVMRLMEMSAELSGEQAFGLRLSVTRRLSSFGVVGMLARDEPTLRQALDTLNSYLYLHNESLSTHIHESAGVAVIEQVFLPSVGAGRQSVELTLGALYHTLCLALGPDWKPRSVSFAHPPPANLAWHRSILGGNLLFSQDYSGIALSSADMDAPLLAADPVMRQQMRALVREDLAGRMGICGEVEQLITALLPTGRCSADQVALHLGVDRRTVHRRLAAEGSSFARLLDAIRREHAQRLMAYGDRKLSDIAPLLGFSSLSAFSRWRHGQKAASDNQE